jgi:hypothetical protein
MTYGSNFGISPEYYPDLVAVVATNGLEGYIKK